MRKSPNSVIHQIRETNRRGKAVGGRPATVELLLAQPWTEGDAQAYPESPEPWLVREAPPDMPWEPRPGRDLKPRRKRRVSVRKPGQPGTKRLVAQYGDRLVCVRYVYDEEEGKRFKSAELLLEESPWMPERARIAPDQLVGLRVDYDELDLRQVVKQAGGRWDRVLQVWVLPYAQAVKLHLQGRVTHSTPARRATKERPPGSRAKPTPDPGAAP